MALYVNSNAASLNAQRNLYASGKSLNTSLQRLSSGLRINSAKDDAAGLAISNKMTAQIRGINQAVRNANDGISLAQTAEGALNETTNILQRMRELSVQSGNDTNQASDRTALMEEFTQLNAELDRITSQTSFNGQKLLDGSFSGKVFQIGYDAGQVLNLSLSKSMGKAGLSTATLSIGGGATSANIASAITEIDDAITTVDQQRSKLGAFQNRLDSTISNLMNVNENLTASRSRIMDADFAKETAAMTRAQILQQSGISMLAQSNQLPQSALSLIG